MELRDYQKTAIDEVRVAFLQHRRVLLVAPTGAGKTVMFSYIAKSAIDKRRKICILAHREELIEQISQTLTKFDVDHGFIAARRPIDLTKQVQVAGVHTLKNRAARINWKPHLIICDEAHHATAGSWAKILQSYPNAHVLGVTATPERLDGTGLGNVFGAMVRGPEVSDLIANGFLSPVRYYCPKTVNTDGMKMRMGDYKHSDVDERVNNSRVTGEAVDWYRKLCDGAPAVAFCASIKHSEHVADTFRAAGYRWTSLDSTMTSEDRRAAVLGLGNGSLHGISSCDIISEGFDLPIVTAAILLRPTASLGLYLQQIGRVLRVAPGKSHAIIVDHVGNCGSTRGQQWIEKHGFAEDVREWTLEGRAKRSGAAPVRLCGSCYAVVPIGADVCPECGEVKPPVEEKPIEAEAGELEEVVAEKIRKKKAKQEQAQAKTLEDLIALGKSRKYRNPAMWAKYILEARGWHQVKLKKKLTDEEEKHLHLAISKSSRFKITQEEWSKRVRMKYAKLTQEQKTEKAKKGWLALTPEKRKEKTAKAYSKATVEQKEKWHKGKYARLTPEQKKEKARKFSEYRRAKREHD